jgi:hypothetical protein
VLGLSLPGGEERKVLNKLHLKLKKTDRVAQLWNLARPRDSDKPHYYPITIDLEYRLLSRRVVVQSGCGRTIRLASTCVQFESGDRLPPEMKVEISIAWPARLNNAVSLQLYLLGRTVRSPEHCITVEIQRHEFRTRRERPPIVGQPKLA